MKLICILGNSFLNDRTFILQDQECSTVINRDYLPYIKVKHIRFKIVTVAENLKKTEIYYKKVCNTIYFILFCKYTFYVIQ